jgi:hypothetical protein
LAGTAYEEGIKQTPYSSLCNQMCSKGFFKIKNLERVIGVLESLGEVMAY